MALKLIHCSDIHLGAPFLFLGNRANEHAKRVISAFKRSVDLAIDKQVGIYIIAGDLFHTPYPDTLEQQIALDEFKRLAEADIKILLLPGNHDYGKDGIYTQEKFLKRLPDDLFLLEINGSKGVVIEDLGVRAYSLTVFDKIHDIVKVEDDLINIALVHASIDTGRGGRDITVDKLKSWGCDYVALGDWHGYLELSKGINYCGSPEILNSDQDGAGFVLEVEIDGKNIKLEKQKVGTLISERVILDVGKFNSTQDLYESVKKLSDPNKILNLELEGLRGLELSIDIEQLLSYLEDSFYHIKIKDNTLFKLSDSDLEQLSKDMLIGSYVDHLKRKRSNGDIDEMAYQEALQIGVQLLKGNNAD